MFNKFDLQRKNIVVSAVSSWLMAYCNSILEDELNFTQSTFEMDAKALIAVIKQAEDSTRSSDG